MANPHSREFPSRQRRPLVIPAFPDDTDSRTACALPLPFPPSAADFMDVQLGELVRLHDRLNRLSQRFNPLIEACLTGTVPVDMFTAVCLLRLRSDVCELARQADQVAQSNWRRWIQVNARR